MADEDAQALARAVSLHRSGAPDQAIRRYRAVLRKHPGHAEALRLIAHAYTQVGDRVRAIASLQAALVAKPDLPDGHFNLGTLLQAEGRINEAIGEYQRAIARNPADIRAFNNLGNALLSVARSKEAIPHFERVLALKPNLAEAHMNLGNALLKLHRNQEALQHHQRAIELNPKSANALVNLGNSLQALHRYEEAIESYRKAIVAIPGYAPAYLDLGNALHWLGRYDEAAEKFAAAIALDPDFADAHAGLANTLMALNRDDEATRHYDRAIALAPERTEAKRNKGIFCLHRGLLAEGWDLFEHRWADTESTTYPRYHSETHWNGEYVDGVLVAWGEQGLGDQIIFASMVGELLGRARDVILEVEPRLMPLFKRSFPGLAIAELVGQTAGPADAQVPVGSLGKFLRRSWADFPRRDGGYLVADPDRTRMLRERLASDGRRPIGLSWISTNALIGKSKSATLRDFAALFALPGCRFVDLQYGDTTEERAAVERELGVKIEHLDDIDNKNDIDGLAALISACDLVVTVSNTTAHLAGALGRPTLVLVPFGRARLWYWFRDRDDSPWYPRARIIRQGPGQRWTETIGAARDLVSKMAGAM